jgi:predicted phage-related endonuclease
MQRGIDLEPIARDLFTLQTGIVVKPTVIALGWAMASLDGFSEADSVIVEIKCPSDADHSIALEGKVPDHYYPQLQHQIYVTGFSGSYYFSFDGIDGVAVFVERDDEYIDRMIEEEKEFYECLINRTPPSQNECIQRNDKEWEYYARKWKQLNESIQCLEKEEESIRKHLIDLSGSSANVRGSGISLCQIKRKGNIDYSKIPELKAVDVEKYRKESTTNWRITNE